jgi:hypothetical protein
LKIGVCWMLTPNDSGLDGEKTDYLKDQKRETFRHLDSGLYDFLRRKVHGHENELKSRNVKHFSDTHFPKSQFFSEVLTDSAAERQSYFQRMWDNFQSSEVDLIFFDPDDGMANNNQPKRPKKPGHKGTAKKLFREEVSQSLDNGSSVLLYQHFDHLSKRKVFVPRIGKELAGMTDAKRSYSFWTPHLVFFLVPLRRHSKAISNVVENVRASDWTIAGGCPTSKENGRRHILVGEHSETTA